MRRVASVALVLAFAAMSCVFGDSPRGAADEMAALASKVETATYAAVYRFNFVRQPAPGISTHLEIVQQPPVQVRKVRSETKREDGETVDLTYWLVANADGDFVCNGFEDVGVRCTPNPVAQTVFGSAKLDPFFDAPLEPSAFSSVRKESRQRRISGEPATCFEAVPAPDPTATPAPSPVGDGTPAPTTVVPTERFRYELCYAVDGILLLGRRTSLDEAEASNAESFVELSSLSRVVEPGDLRMPGPIADPDDLSG